MKVLFCCATYQELKVVKEAIKSLDFKQHLPFEYFCTWVGNYHSLFSLSQYLSQHGDSSYFLVNIGVCGYCGSSLPCIQGSLIKHIQIQKEEIVPQPFLFAPLRTIISSEIPVDTLSMVAFETQKNFVVDMESYGIEYVAQKLQIPCLFLKVPIDQIWEETQHFDYQDALEKLRTHLDYHRLVECILVFLEATSKV